MSNVEYGDSITAITNEILRTVVGSGVHGIAIEGTDDRDEMGIYVPPPGHLLGVANYRDDYVYRTQPEGHRSGPGDLDLTIYSLRKYLRLATKGNPTALLPLFAPEKDVLKIERIGYVLRNSRHLFLSQAAVERFLGYMHSQHERMLGQGKRNRVPNRPELVERYGYDVKYASHAYRLAYQGWEIAVSGHLTLPLPEDTCREVLAIKTGQRKMADVSEMITGLETQTRWLLDHGKCPLPKEADIDKIETFSIKAHLDEWNL